MPEKDITEYERYYNVTAGDCVIDIGAHTGEESVPWSKIAKIIYAIEPNPYVLPKLRENLSNAGNVAILMGGIMDFNGTMTFILRSTTTSSGFIDFDADTDEIAKIYCIPVETLDSLTQRYNLTVIDFLKIDAEGAEAQIIIGGIDTIKNKVRNLCIAAEHSINGFPQMEDIMSRLVDLNLEIKTEDLYIYGWNNSLRK